MSRRMTGRGVHFPRKPLLAVGWMAVAMAITVPIVIGVLNAPASQAQSQTAALSPTATGAKMQIEVASAKQEKATDAVAAAPANKKAWTFDVVSIRSSPPGQGQQQIGPTPDGYRMRNMFLMFPILTAYVPLAGGAALNRGSEGFPDWVINDAYDIDAKVSEGDLANWQNPALQPEMLRSMLQSMLANRLKLVVHRQHERNSRVFAHRRQERAKVQRDESQRTSPGLYASRWRHRQHGTSRRRKNQPLLPDFNADGGHVRIRQCRAHCTGQHRTYRPV